MAKPSRSPLIRAACALALLFFLSLAPFPALTVQADAPTVLRVTPDGVDSVIDSVCGGGWTLDDPDPGLRPCGFQHAIQGRVTSGGNWQLWVKAGKYFPGTSDRNATFSISASPLAIYGGFAGHETALDQRNPAANVTILSGDIGVSGDASDNSYHVVTFVTVGAAAILDGFTITGGHAETAFVPDGGAIYNMDASPTLANLIISGSAAQRGGGLFNSVSSTGSSPSLMNVIFIDNTATQSGGGIYNSSGVFISGSSSPTLTNVAFIGNSAAVDGGGMYNSGGSATVIPGLPSAPPSSPTLANVTFSGNTASRNGGGMYDGPGGSMPDIINPLNPPIVYYPSSPRLTNVTFHGNVALSGGAIYNDPGTQAYAGAPTIINSILWGDTPDPLGGSTAATTITHSDVQGGFAGAGNIDVDPLLGALGSYGSAVSSFPLLPGSPAIDAGSDAACAAAVGAPNFGAGGVDQRGVARPQGSHCDMGAFEARPFTLAKASGDSQYTPRHTAFASPLVVTVSGTDGDPVDGAMVTFSAPTSGASAILTGSPAVVANGLASVTAQSNGILGSYNVTASLSGAAPVTFSLTNDWYKTFLPALVR